MSENSDRNKNKKVQQLQPHRFQPGQSGNPGGRPKTMKAMRDALIDRLEELDPRTGKTFARLISERMISAALRGSVEAFKAIRDSVEGRPVTSIELSGREGGAIAFHQVSIEELDRQILGILEKGKLRAEAALRDGTAKIEPPLSGEKKPN